MVTMTKIMQQAVFRAIADPTRREILNLLRVRPRAVGDLASNFRSTRPAISKHLRLLESTGLVVARRRGTARVCRLNAEPLRAVEYWLREYQTFWKGTLKDLKSSVEEDR